MLTSFHPDKVIAFEVTEPLSTGSRVYRLRESAGALASGVDLFLTDEQARQLAAAILSTLYPVTAAMAEAVGETVQ